MPIDRPWGGRFDQPPAVAAAAFTESLSFDRRLGPYDVRQSIVYVEALEKAGILTGKEAAEIRRGLQTVAEEIRDGRMPWRVELEDVHMNVEARLIEIVGPVGGKVHTGRSRNDQVATDLRMYMLAACDEIVRGIDRLEAVYVARAREHIDTILPGYTHTKRAQPVRLAHHLLAHRERLERDRGRFLGARERADESPLGSGALSGTPFPIDRDALARGLGFSRASRNSIDAVSSRDIAAEVACACAILQTGLSRTAEELVLWSSDEFGFVELGDAYCTGSSLMPHKKNPDVVELVRARAARTLGDAVTLVSLEKGLPLAYNRDLQEDKEPLFDAVGTASTSLEVLGGALESATFDVEWMRETATDPVLMATEAADYLVEKGVPFREAHQIVGKLVRVNPDLQELGIDALRSAHPDFGPDVFEWLGAERTIERRRARGGTARATVLAAIDEAESVIRERLQRGHV